CEAVQQNAERALKVELAPGEVTPEENKVFEKLRPFYTSPEWVYKKSSQQKFSSLLPGSKKAKSRHKARKLIIAHVAVDREKKIEQALLCGDFFIQPADVLEDIEKSLRGVEATDEEKILGTVKDALEKKKAQIPMLDPRDFAIPLMQAARDAAALT
ncbi:MAG TPA: hypothetical protein VN203_08620, partial [Candidatus Acidoferrum sp.]|nr:hypothetical protein [Candidatus Acidoferrum sp.]